MDEKLSWCDNIQYIKNKIAKGIGIISKARRLLNNETLGTIYNCFVYPYLNYCVEVWGNTFKTHLQTLVKLQKRVLNIISYSTWRASVDHLYKHYSIIQLKKIHFFKIALLMFRVKNMFAPLLVRELFTENRYVHDYNTRQKINFMFPTLSEIIYREQLVIKE